jgi:FkbM family methyltransferase
MKLWSRQIATGGAEGGVDHAVHKAFFARPRTGRVFVDVGAARPDYLSISSRFRSMGWKVLSIEPNPEFCRLYEGRGLEVLQYACGERDADDVPFQVVDSHGADYGGGKVSFESFSSLGIKEGYASLKADLDVRTIPVKLRRLDTILREHAPEVERIDILSIDVEGWELEVLRGIDLERYRPRVMIVENYFNTRDYRVFARDHGYRRWRRIYPNDVYVRRGFEGWLDRRRA